jgi:xanthine dehydrogenase molybdenum-binding subunit
MGVSPSADRAAATVAFSLNGEAMRLEVAPDEKVLDLLRDRCGIQSAKRGCGQGQCGSCVVLIDGRPVTCCATPAAKIDGKAVVTNEGLDPRVREVLARCYAAVGAVQCGFCTPGFVVRSAALLAADREPDRRTIAKAFRGHLCRCTGYVKILDAVELAASVLSREQALPPLAREGGVGARLPKLGAESAARGEQRYVTDVVVPGMLHGALRLSDHARAEVRRIDSGRARSLPGVVAVVTAEELPGERFGGIIEQDWPCFVACGETTCMTGDVIAAVAALDERTARRAAALIDVDYQPLDPVVDPAAALRAEAPRVHVDRDNLLGECGFSRGDAALALADSAHVVRDRFHTAAVEHLYLEPEACLAMPCDDGRLEVLSQGQGIYDDRRQIAGALGLDEAAVRVRLVATGGAFGGKEDLSVQIQTALLAWVTGRPVRLALSRAESIRMHPKRHAFDVDYELGCDARGRLTAARVRMLADTGAYASVGMKVIERAVGHALGPYFVPHAEVHAEAAYTNHPPGGAMRGFGVGQVAFALEQLIDRLGEQVGLDGYQIRELNLLREGQRFGPGQRLFHVAGLLETLQAVRDDYYRSPTAGIACAIKNVGLGNGKRDAARARIDVLAGGRLKLSHGMTEMGQGLNTVVVQILREEAAVGGTDSVQVEVSTDAELDAGMTTASRATALVGAAVLAAARKLRRDLDEVDGQLALLAGRSYDGEICSDPTTGPDADEPVLHQSYGFATHVVLLDEQTGEVREVVAAHDVGRAINPALVEGQIEGSVHMGLGVALREQLPCEQGRPTVAIRKLGVLRAPEMPAVKVVLVEQPGPMGPYGARGVGEAGLIPVPPAVASARYRFDGKRRTRLPMDADGEGNR